jgi:GTPase
MPFTVAILGRPNVGKSTLFNRLVGARRALVDDTPGVTRDRIEGEARLGHLRFRLIDTAGLEDGPPGSLPERLRRQTETALEGADLGLFLVDARAGITPADRELADWLRRQPRPILLLANKAEGRTAEAQAVEAWELGLGEPIPVSAEHGDGLPDLLQALAPLIGEAEEAEEPEEGGPLRLAVVGRPNVGKSSLINRLLREERLLTGPEPGLTRDAVTVAWAWRDRRIELVDTAGLRRRARVSERLERLSTSATTQAIRRAHVVALVIDATTPLERQDLTIANLAIDEGRALVLAANKWDLVEDPAATRGLIEEGIRTRLAQVEGLQVVPLSALTGRGLDRLLPAVVAAETRWSRRIGTGELNRWLHAMLEAHAPPLVSGRRLKIRYATQARTRPPTFVLFANFPGALPDSYLRYLARGLRQAFDLGGAPLRFHLRKGDNPYAGG